MNFSSWSHSLQRSVLLSDVIKKMENKENPIKKLFGVLKGWKINTQKMKDKLRKEEKIAYKRKHK